MNLILRPARLADALQANALSERDKLLYLLAGIVISFLAYGRAMARGWDPDHLWFGALTLLLTVLGTVYCYQQNERGDGQRFIERYAVLSVPIGLLTHALYYLLYYGVAVVLHLNGQLDSSKAMWVAGARRS